MSEHRLSCMTRRGREHCAECACGWHSQWHAARHEAEQECQEHIDDAKASEATDELTNHKWIYMREPNHKWMYAGIGRDINASQTGSCVQSWRQKRVGSNAHGAGSLS